MHTNITITPRICTRDTINNSRLFRFDGTTYLKAYRNDIVLLGIVYGDRAVDYVTAIFSRPFVNSVHLRRLHYHFGRSQSDKNCINIVVARLRQSNAPGRNYLTVATGADNTWGGLTYRKPSYRPNETIFPSVFACDRIVRKTRRIYAPRRLIR